MRASAHCIIVALAAVLLAGCVGKNFTMPTDGALKLGVTTPQDAVALLGEPLSKRSETVTSVEQNLIPTSIFGPARQLGTYDYFSYLFVDTAGQALIGSLSGRRPSRSMSLTFWNDRLVFYNSSSSFDADATDFDDSRVAQIARGRSRAADVIALLGKPTGGAIFPQIAIPEGRVLIYDYAVDNLSANQRHVKFLAIYLDGSETVRDMHSENTTNPLPAPAAAPAPVFVPIIVPSGK
jgi:hypothetical protein